ncbi:hypothetical protein LB565_19320 [Mesorhizobium sp. CA14]|uniref:hypothetical protein n=1 Tax=Mesorhizobium sp. CA14 TaxID=2876642 RepID=UPI001CCCD823|nr:hypothetical protein [Mesorhizobium sp. CA14]MBZ9850138.1 hypothetical protein [Mesorhizobium sp. CA14]
MSGKAFIKIGGKWRELDISQAEAHALFGSLERNKSFALKMAFLALIIGPGLIGLKLLAPYL